MRKATLAMIVVFAVLALSIIAVLLFSFSRYARRGAASIGIIGGADGPTSIYSAENTELLVDKTVDASGIREIEAAFGSDEVDIYPSEDGNIRVVQYGVNLPENRILTAEKHGGTLSIGHTKGSFQFGIAYNSRSMVEIYLPESFCETLDLHLSSGDLRINKDLDLAQFTVGLSSGYIQGSGVISTKQAELRVSSGDMLLGTVNAEQYWMNVSSGSITVDALTGSGQTEISSGDIHLRNVSISERMDVSVSSGAIDIDLAGDPALEFTSRRSSGDVYTYFDTQSNEDDRKNLHATVGSGDFKKLDVNVSSGTVRVNRA